MPFVSPGDTGLPFVVAISWRDGHAPSTVTSRAGLIVVGLIVIVTMVTAFAYFITRAVRVRVSEAFAVADAPAPLTVSVDRISYAVAGAGKSKNKDLTITIGAIYGLAAPVPATVRATVTLNGAFYTSVTGTTDNAGLVSFLIRNTPAGTFATTMTLVSAAGLTWDNQTPANGVTK